MKTRPPTTPESCGSGRDSVECTDFFLRITATMEVIRADQQQLCRNVLALESRLAALEMQSQQRGYQWRQGDGVPPRDPMMRTRATDNSAPQKGSPSVGLVIALVVAVMVAGAAWVCLFV